MEVLRQHKQVWDNKKILRDIYHDWYQMIQADLMHSKKPILEIGAGTGNFKEYKQNVIASDIIPCDWIDACLDAHHLPFEDSSISNIVMIDVLHHLSDPIAFFEDAHRVVEPTGKIILLEPYPSPFSKLVYQKFHPEPFLFNVDYFARQDRDARKDPWDANQAIAYLLFFKNKQQFSRRFEGKIIIQKCVRFSFLRYPLSGGFSTPTLYPKVAVPMLKFFESLLTPFAQLAAFRCYITLQVKK